MAASLLLPAMQGWVLIAPLAATRPLCDHSATRNANADTVMPVENSAASPAASLMNAPGAAGIAPERLADIAIEVERLCGVVRAAAPQLSFNDEPSFFAATLSNRAR